MTDLSGLPRWGEGTFVPFTVEDVESVNPQVAEHMRKAEGYKHTTMYPSIIPDGLPAFPRMPQDDTDPCENCGRPVIAFRITGFSDIHDRPRLMELTDYGGLTDTTKWAEHTPERCRAARQEQRHA